MSNKTSVDFAKVGSLPGQMGLREIILVLLMTYYAKYILSSRIIIIFLTVRKKQKKPNTTRPVDVWLLCNGIVEPALEL